MKTIIRTETYPALPGEVFDLIDDLGITGMHMTKSSMALMGSKLDLNYLTEHHTGPGSKYRWTGKMIGIKMDFTVEVTKWIYGVEKSWETIGEARMIIYSWFRMHLLLRNQNGGAVAELSITYEKPIQWYLKILSFLFAGLYARWCLKNMLSDSKKAIIEREKNRHISIEV